MFGCLNLKKRRFYWKQSKQSDSKSFCSFLTQLRQRFPGKQIILILDNASIHKSKYTRQYLKCRPQIHLFYLPPYSPEYNPVELIWKWIKPKVHGFSFSDNLAEIIKRFRQHIWHFNAGWLPNPINLKLETYAKIL